MTSKPTSPRLGRGIAALLGTEAAGAGADAVGGTRRVPIEHLTPSALQPRQPMPADSLDELAASIRANGILQPLLARPKAGETSRYEIIAGERRWRAAQQAGLKELPVLVRQLSDREAVAAALVENLQRQDLNAIEEAEGYRRLITEFSLTQEQLSSHLGKSRSHVSNTLRLLNLPLAVLKDVRAGTLSAGHARALLAHPEPADAAQLVLSRGLNVRQTEALVARASERRPLPRPLDRPTRRSPHDLDTVALEHELSERTGVEVRLKDRGGRGTLWLRYTTLEQLDTIIARLSS
ncbi:MAG: ParB/RepB/Spo0J family partition protein [Acidisphaera sp.]|nr:ParB/RepB/Spo0J family partition protein [Acidisphaera sp.]MBV9811799.1 ParB/RepB/Spo0J family partition protein [Acetobacteraceae bacterium]